jgi:hypothetical protein
MIMRQIVSYLIAALTCIVLVSASPAFGAVAENNELTKVISQCHDTHMTVEDLAFFLATHNYNATPKDGYVQVTIGGTIYKAVPNSATGLAELSIIN